MSQVLSSVAEQLTKPNGCACKMERAEVVGGGLLETRGSSAKALELMEEDFDQIALGVGFSIESRFSLASRIGTNDGFHPAAFDRVANSVGVVACVSDHGMALRVFEERFGDGGFVLLARRDLDVDRPAVRVDDRVDFRRESTT